MANISSKDPHPRRRLKMFDSEMSYVDVGEGDPIVLLHGNPTSSYLWRNVIPNLSGLGRVLAPDLIGFGASSKSPAGAYRFVDQVRYLDEWFNSLKLTKNVTLVLHDWGTALGFHRAARFPEQVKAIAHMEAIAIVRNWADFGPAAEIFKALRTDKGEMMVLDENFFVEKRLPAGVIRPLSEEEIANYRAPFKNRDDRLPTLILPREIPVDGEPKDVSAIVEHYGAWLTRSQTPKLMVVAESGVLTGRSLDFARTWRNQRELKVQARHYLQEDVPNEIGAAVARFIKTIG